MQNYKTNGWLVNDTLTCIPGTKTLWHFLLDALPGIKDKTNGLTPFSELPILIEREYFYSSKQLRPDYIIRNASFFRPLRIKIPTISLLQDPYEEGTPLHNMQVDVCNQSTCVVYNSEYTKNMYSKHVKRPGIVIPVGTNSDLFKENHPKKSKNTIIYVGSTNEEYKGFSLLLKLIENSNYNFILVMKDDFQLNNDRVKVYNKISQEKLSELYNLSDLLVCTSKKETLHLAGIEAGFCNVPIVANDVGIYSKIKNDSRWGIVVNDYSEDCYLKAIDEILKSDKMSPRIVMEENKLSIKDFQARWKKLVSRIMEKVGNE